MTRYLLLIPALFLFLSNVPFIHKMEMKKVAVAVKKNGCCRKAESAKGKCSMSSEQTEQKACHKPTEKKEQPCKQDEGKCAKQTESTCICICCFQFAAPAQIGSNIQFKCDGLALGLTSYLLQEWKDPHLAVPWQPPDDFGFLI